MSGDYMKFYNYSIVTMLMLIFCMELSGTVSEKREAVLNDRILACFLDDFPVLHRELTEYSPLLVQAFEAILQEGSAMQNIETVRSDLEGAMKNQGVRGIIEKHGCGGIFTAVYITIFTAYSVLIAEDLLQASSNPSLNVYIGKLKETITPEDLIIVRKNRLKLEKMILSISEE